MTKATIPTHEETAAAADRDPAHTGSGPAAEKAGEGRRKASPKTLRLVKTLHILTASVWFGALVVVWALTASSLGDPERFLATARWTPWIFSRVLLGAALVTILIGLFYGIWTNWGFFRHRWMLLKWVMLVVLIPCTACTIGTIGTILLAAQDKGIPASVWPEAALPFALLTIQAVFLVTMVAVSVYKPRLQRRK
jgi:hypothetical protein